MPPLRRILHVDMDAFYAAVEQRDDPSLAGKPVVVGGSAAERGVVAAASYEARAFGVRSAMSMARAVRLCPALVVVRPDFARYRAVSTQVFAIFREATPLVEPLSLDEAYLDVTENAWGETLAVNVARRIKDRIRSETGLTASAGVAPNKFLAKIASGWQKPDGLTVIAPERVEAFLAKLPVEALWGVGPVTARKLREAGLLMVTDLRRPSVEVLRHLVGGQAECLRQLALGIDERPVVPDHAPKSCGSERTYAKDLGEITTIRTEIERMASGAAEWLERRQLFARTVTVKVRYDDFTTVTRSDTADPATRDRGAILRRALALLERTEAGHRKVRLLGVSVHALASTVCDADRPGHETERLPFPPV